MLSFMVISAIFHAQSEKPVDHGVAAPVIESRGVVATKDGNGRYLVLGNAMDFMVVTDVDTEESWQIFMPPGVPGSYPFGSIMGSNGKFYICHGSTFMEFDPTSREWTFHDVPVAGESAYMGFTEGPDGVIWAGGYPGCHLVSFNPKTRELKDHGRMDLGEEYPSYLAVDSSGWVYSGIGTARCNIVAYNPKTGEKRQIVDEKDRVHGTGSVYAGKDGKVYGTAGSRNYRMYEGEAVLIERGEAAAGAFVGNIGWGNRQFDLPDGRKVVDYVMPERYLKVENPKTGETKTIAFDYKTEGAQITSLEAGPDGKIYVSSCHPMHLAVYNPAESKLEDWGPVPGIGGGNFCAITVQGDYVLGAEYAGGRLYGYDTSKTWNPNGKDDAMNPRMLAQWKTDICRPRTALGHPDGKHVMIAGFAGYGLCGGGIGIYNLETGEDALLTADKDLLAGHSTITLKALPNGDLVGGTSVDAPGGGHTTASEAELYILDWETKKIVFHTVPVPGNSEIISIQIGPDGLVYGLSNSATFFVFDPEKKQVVHTEKFGQYGGVPRHALQIGPDGKLYAILSRAIVKITPGTFEHEKLIDSPVGISAGGALHDRVMYFASGTHFWSYRVPGL